LLPLGSLVPIRKPDLDHYFAKCRKAICSIHWTSAFRYLPLSRERPNVASVTSASMNGDLLCFTAPAERSIPASSHNLATSPTELVGLSLSTCVSPFPQGQYPVPQREVSNFRSPRAFFVCAVRHLWTCKICFCEQLDKIRHPGVYVIVQNLKFFFCPSARHEGFLAASARCF
jgi:hypothetical protein